MATFPKVSTVETSKLQSRELVHVEFSFYNVSSVRGFSSMTTFVYERTRMIRELRTGSKQSPVRIILFILKTFKNEQCPCKHLIVDEDGALENSTDVTNLLVGELKIFRGNTCDDISWINGKNERHNRSIHKILISGLIYSNQHENK